jgi:Uma2 family endonuclease
MSEAMTVPEQPRAGALPLPEPRGAEWTWEDLDALPDGGPKTEIVEGALVVSPKPAHNHQFAATRLVMLLEQAAPPEWVVLPEVDLELARNLFQPDVVVLAESAYGHTPLQASGVLLAVEVTSPSSRRMDRIIKPGALAEAGVPHYWRVDLEAAPYIEVYELDGRAYRLAHTLRAGTTGRLEQPFAIEVDPAILVRAPH